jgi:hypothetical protein
MGVLSHMGIFEAKWRNWGAKMSGLASLNLPVFDHVRQNLGWSINGSGSQ